MKLSKIVMSAIMFLGATAHADIVSDFIRAKTIAAQKEESSIIDRATEQARQERLHREQEQKSEIRKVLARKGIDVRNMTIEFEDQGPVACNIGVPGKCDPVVETYFAKSGDIVCKMTVVSLNERTISADCFDVNNPQPKQFDEIEPVRFYP